MPQRVFTHVSADEVANFVAICADAGWQSSVAREKDGKYRVTCTMPETTSSGGRVSESSLQRIFKDVPEDEVANFVAICADAGGQSKVARQGNGLYSVTCAITRTTTGGAGESTTSPILTSSSLSPSAIVPASIVAAAHAVPTIVPASTTTSSPASSNSSAEVEMVPVGQVDVHKRDTDLSKLHPSVQKAVKAVEKQLEDENIPMRLFEAYRSPQRQAHLYAKGRTLPGRKVTNARPWQSYHQFGLAADFVRFENGKWNWNDKTAKEKQDWERYHEIARDNGLEPLSWERPHVQYDGASLTELTNGRYPEGGNASWEENLASVIASWPGAGAPPSPAGDDRPPMPTSAILASSTQTAGALEWHSRFGGDAWAYDKRGVYTRDHTGQLKTWRTVGAPITVQEVLARYGDAIEKASAKYGVAPELIVMTIATETAVYRRFGFTGPETYRWEQGFEVNATGDSKFDGTEKGDYSAGPMQVMSDTARWMNKTYRLGYTQDIVQPPKTDPESELPFFKNKPKKAPEVLGLYDAAICVDVGTAYIKHQMPQTLGNPLLVAAAYNAGGLYPSSGNRWRIRSHGNHIDRAAEWYGDACAVLYG